MPLGRYVLGLCSCARYIGAIGRHFLRRSRHADGVGDLPRCRHGSMLHPLCHVESTVYHVRHRPRPWRSRLHTIFEISTFKFSTARAPK